VVISILLYVGETWTLKPPDVRILTTFHNRCVWTILGVTRYSQWKEHITTAQLAAQFGMAHLIADYLLDRRLRWLGHLGRMDEGRTPKQLLFGEVFRRRPFHGVKKRWRDEVAGDLHAIGIGDWWFQDRKL